LVLWLRRAAVPARLPYTTLFRSRLDELLDEVLRRSGGRAPIPALPPADLTDDEPLETPFDEDFRVGTMALGWDPETSQVIIEAQDRKSTRLNSSHVKISYAVFCL